MHAQASSRPIRDTTCDVWDYGVLIDGQGRIIVSNRLNHRIQVLQ